MLSNEIRITPINAASLFLEISDDSIKEDLYQTLRYTEPNFQKNKFSKWDGVTRLFNKKKGGGVLPYGLISHLMGLAKERGWKLVPHEDLKLDIKPITREQVQAWVDSKVFYGKDGQPIKPYEFQVEGLFLAARYSRMTLLAATSAGKSLMLYMIVRFLEEVDPDNKVLLVVPSVNLVSQMAQDFAVYSKGEPGWINNVHSVSAGVEPRTNKSVTVSTFQSLQKMDEDYFLGFKTLFGDEAHTFAAKSLEYISSRCVNAYNRVGVTGTLKIDELHHLQVMQHFGTIRRIVSTKELQDAGRAAKTSVTMVHLSYNTRDRQLMNVDGTFEGEIEFLNLHQRRNEILSNLISGLKGNTLALFGRIDGHLKIIEAMIRAKHPHRKVYVIDGSVENKARDEIKRILEVDTDSILLASYGTLSTGVSINHLHNLVFGSSSQSNIRVIQSIGRMLRLHDTKEVAKIYDLVDDLKYMGRPNHTLRHAGDRYSYYTSEGHPVKRYQIACEITNTNSVFGNEAIV